MDTLKDVPEFFETQLDESIVARTESLATFRELGPPDLCHITKANVKPGVKEVGSYHYVSGVDASSSATLAAYLNSLTYALKLMHGSRNLLLGEFALVFIVDVRVEVKIPGGVDTTAEIWQETYISALLRSILYSDDVNYRLAGFRWQLGSDPEIQVATVVSNHLTAGIMKYFNPEVASLLSRAYIGMGEEVKAVHILYNALRQNPMSYSLLHVQTDFLLSKKKTDFALKLAKQAVNCAPSEFVTWAKLTEVYIEISDYESALLTLNSCPMFTYNERDVHRMPTPAKTHLPIKQDVSNSGVLEDDNDRDNNEADVALLRLPAPSLRGTFAKAYALLTLLVAKIGWDELLKCRSSVFVMEEEYRMQKAAEEERKHQKTYTTATKTTTKTADVTTTKNEIVEKLSLPSTNNDNSEKEPSLVVVEKEKQEKTEEEKAKEEKAKEEKEKEGEKEKEEEELNSIPSIVVSDDKELSDKKEKASDNSNDDTNNVNDDDTTTASNFSTAISKSDDEKNDNDENDQQSVNSENLEEVDLDDDKTVVTTKSQQQSSENDAKEAYQKCLENKFSAKSWLKLLEYCADEGDIEHALLAVVKLTVYQERWYHEIIYPTVIAYNLNKLAKNEGLTKIRHHLISMNLHPSVSKMSRH
ncbi:8978_t:CDS:10 [Entrophospora sp. SA101]|nr:15644_t:CDS:10 [Entrophospora sp. SA101]CAJ0766061.1 8978_t:CDS:10 [Entrophospora sp. SA101]CAJ0863099.1 865_t:CDS:10 [Entrophospora sp. SA101]